jgi:hypothetical protein
VWPSTYVIGDTSTRDHVVVFTSVSVSISAELGGSALLSARKICGLSWVISETLAGKRELI